MTLSAFGITVEQPAGWYGEIFRETDGIDDTGPVVHLANTPLILGDRDMYASQTRQLMRAGDAIVCIVNLPSLPNILAAGGERVGAATGWSLWGANDIPFHGVPNHQSSLRKAIVVGERAFDLIAFFGAPAPTSQLVGEIEAVLGSVRVDVARLVRGERLEQYFDAAAAARIQNEVRRDVLARDARHMSPQEAAERRAALPA
jgi:hypothetical protein